MDRGEGRTRSWYNGTAFNWKQSTSDKGFYGWETGNSGKHSVPVQLERPQCQIKHIQPYFLLSPAGHRLLQNKKPSVLSWHHTFDNVQLQTNSNKYWGQRMLLSSRLLSKWWSDWLRSCQQKPVTQTKRWSSINTQDRFLMAAEISNQTKTSSSGLTNPFRSSK